MPSATQPRLQRSAPTGGTVHPDDRSPHTRIEPARRLSPAPGSGRSWRAVFTAIAAGLICLLALGFIGSTTVSWAINRGYEQVPAAYELGAPESLSLTSPIAMIRVVETTEVDQVTLALVDSGNQDVPAEGTTARARIDVQERGSRTSVEVTQPSPNRVAGLLAQHRDVLLLVPTGYRMALDLRSNVGEIDAEGTFTTLAVSSDVGEIRLDGVEAPEGITIGTSVGEVTVNLREDATGDLTVDGDIGDIAVTAPGTARRDVQATSDMGDVTVDPQLSSAAGESVGAITVITSLGDISVSR